MTIVIEQVNEPTHELRDLIGELDAVLNATYEPHQRHGLSLAALFEPHVRFFVARVDGRTAACGGVALFSDYAEVKRMYTRPAARGRGLAKAVLRRIEDEARAAGKPVLRLETGHYQPEAAGLYRSAGFKPCGPFGHYAQMPARSIELSLFFEKSL
jgi:putative acetyltransferase